MGVFIRHEGDSESDKVDLLGGVYTLYSDGRVYVHDRKVRYVHGYRTVPGKFLKHRTDSNGYKYVGLTDSDGETKNHRIHRLLMLNFRYEDGCESLLVNHIDGNRANNDLSNLEWCTYQQNAMHAIENGLRGFSYEYKDYKDAVFILREAGWSNAKIGRAFGKTSETIGAFLKLHGHVDTKKGRYGGKIRKT